jgi:hypothetical protein
MAICKCRDACLKILASIGSEAEWIPHVVPVTFGRILYQYLLHVCCLTSSNLGAQDVNKRNHYRMCAKLHAQQLNHEDGSEIALYCITVKLHVQKKMLNCFNDT